MTPTEIFSLSNTTAMVMWLFMLLLPKWRITGLLIDYKIVPIALSMLYAIYIFQAMQIHGFFDFGSLSAVMELFTEQNLALAGWVHYLAFDLLIGMWILEQNKTINIHHLIIVPCLLATFILGPVGFLLFLMVKSIKKHRS